MKKGLMLSTVVLMSLMVGGCATQTPPQSQSVQTSDLNDDDNDGVINARDKCPNTVLGAKIDNYGCGKDTIAEQRIRLQLSFENDSAVIHDKYQHEIDTIAAFMNKHPNATITIEGHSSKVGSYTYNMALSQKRAAAVIHALATQHNIERERLNAIGYGYSRPIDPGDDEKAHNANRRVMAVVSGTEATIDMKWGIYSV